MNLIWELADKRKDIRAKVEVLDQRVLARPAVDHRTLLVKYLVHIADNEGSSFLQRRNETLFTPEEWAELCQCDLESRE